MGNIVVDILVRPVDTIAWGTTAWIEDVERHIGGNGANTSLAMARLGTRVELLGGVGSDEFGAWTLQLLTAAGVGTTGVEKIDDGETATTVVLVRPDGVRALLHRRGVSEFVLAARPTLSDLASAGCSSFHLANPFALARVRPEAPNLLSLARAAGMSTSVDTGWDPLNQWLEVIEPCLPLTDFLFVNQDEGRMLTGEVSPECISRALRALGASTVVVKLGECGCYIDSGESQRHHPAFAVNPVVDTTGAGDCFVGGFLAALDRGSGLDDAARLANAAGGLSAGAIGGSAGLRSYEATLAWMESAGTAT